MADTADDDDSMIQNSNNIQTLALRALERCDLLAQQSEEADCLTRTFCSPPMLAVHSHVSQWMRNAGMTCRTDAIGNLIGRRESAQKNCKTLLMGSHLDTVPNAGRYDGILGVVLALALVEALDQQEIALPFSLEVIAFAKEEGIRYQSSFLGSRALVGCFDHELLKRTDAHGIEMAEAIRAFGLDPAEIAAAAYQPDQILGFIESHIEQGPILENEQLPVGVVEAITGTTRASLCFRGRAGHAGTTPDEPAKRCLGCRGPVHC
jgi:allantoate deiminase